MGTAVPACGTCPAPARGSCTQTSHRSPPAAQAAAHLPPAHVPHPLPRPRPRRAHLPPASLLHPLPHPRPRRPPTCLLPLDWPLVSVPQNHNHGVRRALGPPPPRRVSTGPRTLAHGCYFALLGFCAPAASPLFPARRGGPSITRICPSSSLRGFQGAGAVSTCALSSSPVERVPGQRAPGPG